MHNINKTYHIPLDRFYVSENLIYITSILQLNAISCSLISFSRLAWFYNNVKWASKLYILPQSQILHCLVYFVWTCIDWSRLALVYSLTHRKTSCSACKTTVICLSRRIKNTGFQREKKILLKNYILNNCHYIN